MSRRLNGVVVSSKYPPEYSGSGLRAHNTYKRLAENFPIDFSVICGSLATNESCDYEHDGVKVKRIACKPFGVPKAFSCGLAGKVLRRLANSFNYWFEAVPVFWYLWKRRGRIDFLHVFGNVNVTSAAVFFARVFRKPLIVEICNPAPHPYSYRPFPLSVFNERKFFQRVPLICISENLREMCRRNGHEETVWCRPNPVNEDRFCPDFRARTVYRRRHTTFDEKDIIVVYVAVFIPRKNHIFLLDVLERLPEKVKLFLAGPAVDQGPHRERDQACLEEIRRRAGAGSLRGRVEVRPGFVPAMEEYIKMADVYAFPTLSEGLGTPMLESIACGVPVVANRLPGVTDVWIRDGRNGYVSPLDPAVFAEKILSAVGIPEHVRVGEAHRILKEAGHRSIDERYYGLIRKEVGKWNSSAASVV
ncbi:MAG: glycosyltransferase family 4 protein [Elusimicrobiota bacterium]